MTLLLAVGIDANGHNIILAWAVVESENRASWEYFLRLLRRAIPEVSSDACVLISDRDKGLLEADAVLGPLVVRAICCRHLRENFVERFKSPLAELFWRAARARTAASFEDWMKKIGDVNPEAEAYLRGIVSKPFYLYTLLY